MQPERSEWLAELVEHAFELEGAQRTTFLAQACGDDLELRAEVDALLQEEERAAKLMSTPAVEFGAKLLRDEDTTGELSTGEMLGDYRIISLLGEGGMGEVYLADDTHFGRQVAIKLIKQGFGTKEFVRHFRQEERILAALNHPNIARLYGGAVTQKGLPYFVMEYVEGIPLEAYSAQHGLTMRERLGLFRKVCAAVSYAHQNLVLHRDLKPANIRVTQEGEPKLLDFGIARLLDPVTAETDNQTIRTAGVMTPGYASPEQQRGERMTTASDTYSLGIVLCELLTGEKPNQRKDDQAEVKKLGGDLDNIVAKALRREPERRYASVGQFSEDIRRYSEGLPIIARKDTVTYRASKFVRRNKAGVAAAALVLLALLGGLITTSWQTRIARQERDHARVAQRKAERLDDFLQTLLGSANPDTGPGRDLKVVQVLDQASTNLDHELAGEPVLLAQAHLTVGQAYAGLREAQPALSHLRTALEIDRRVYGEENLVTARVKAALGSALVALQRRYTEAEPLLRQALIVERRQPPAEQRQLPMILKNEAKALSQMNRIDEAKLMAAESLSLIRKTEGEHSPAYAEGLVETASLFITQRDYAGAEMPYRQAIAIFRRLHAQTPLFASVLTALAYDLILQGKLDEPEGILLEAQKLYRSTVGEQSIAYALDLGCLGWLHFQRGDYPKAEEELRVSQAIARSSQVPQGEQDYVGGTVTLALAMTRNGKAVEAEPLLRESLVLAKNNHLEGTALPENVSAALGECLLDQKRYADAEPLLLVGYTASRKRLGENDPTTVAAARRLHEMYTAWNKPAEAARFAVQASSAASIKPLEGH